MIKKTNNENEAVQPSPTLHTNDKTCPKTCPGEEVPLVGGSQEMPGKPGEGCYAG